MSRRSEEELSGDALLMRSVTIYTRALLDRGGWETPFVPATSSLVSGSLVELHSGQRVTAVDAVAAAPRGAAVRGSATGTERSTLAEGDRAISPIFRASSSRM
jgi:hypothetical protein